MSMTLTNPSDGYAASKDHVFDFMKQVEASDAAAAADAEYKNSDHYKKAVMDRQQDEARNVCLDAVFAKLYKDAVPLSDDYKVAHGEDLDVDCKAFFADRAPKGMDYYVRDMAENGNATAKKLIDGVDAIIKEEYRDRAYHPGDYSADDMEFKLTDEISEKLGNLSRDIEFEDLATVIQDNVKRTASSEIARAKEEKEKNLQLENDLANDLNITNEAAIDQELQRRNLRQKTLYQPSLFEGMMIGFSNKYATEAALGRAPEVHPYGSMDAYVAEGTDPESLDSRMTYAFMESVKEYTKVSMLKALKFDKSLNSKMSVDFLAQRYARNNA